VSSQPQGKGSKLMRQIAAVAKRKGLPYDDMQSKLQHQIEVGDQLLAAQRERLIKLTEIKNMAWTAAVQFGFINHTHFHNFGTRCVFVTENWSWIEEWHQRVRRAVVALEVDTALPPKETVRC
jgi:hypothetical protein